MINFKREISHILKCISHILKCMYTFAFLVTGKGWGGGGVVLGDLKVVFSLHSQDYCKR